MAKINGNGLTKKEEGMIVLGTKVRDKVSGLTGITVSRTEYLNGCVQYGVQPKLKEGKTDIVTWSIDEETLVVVGKPVKVRKKPVGGATHRI